MLNTSMEFAATSTQPIAAETTHLAVPHDIPPPFVPADHPYVTFARGIYVWLVPLLIAILAVSLVGNGSIVLSTPCMRKRLNPYNKLCISLAAADAWAALLLMIGLFLNSYMPIVLKVYKRSECLAASLEILRIAGMLSSNLHLLALAFNQFIGILYPLRYKAIVTTKRVRRLICLIWLLPLPYVGGWFFVSPHDGFRTGSCSHRFYSRFPFRLLIFLAFTIPLLITISLYIVILFSLLRAKYNSLSESSYDNSRRKVRSKLKLLRTTLIILSTFTLSWGLCVFYFLMVCVEGCPYTYLKDVSFRTGFFINSSINFLVTLKLASNPLIYALRMTTIRQGLGKLARAIICGECSTLPQGTYYISKDASARLPISRQASNPPGDGIDSLLRDDGVEYGTGRSYSLATNRTQTSLYDFVEFRRDRSFELRTFSYSLSASSGATTPKSLENVSPPMRKPSGVRDECLRIKLGRLSAPIELVRLMEYRYWGRSIGQCTAANGGHTAQIKHRESVDSFDMYSEGSF